MYKVILRFLDHNFMYLSNDYFIIQHIERIFTNFIITYNKDIYCSAYFKLSSPKIYPNKSYEYLFASENDLNIEYSYEYDGLYQQWNYKDTVFPPMQIRPLKGQFLVIHGSGFTLKNKVYIMPAKSMSGKTSFTTFMVSKGAKIISDDLLFISTTTQRVYPYKKPVGIREKGLKLIPNLEVIVKKLISHDTMTFINKEGYRTWLMDLDSLFPNCYVKVPSHVDYIVFFDKSTNFDIIENLSLKDSFLRIYRDLCNSGLYNEMKVKELMKFLSTTKKISYISTFDFDKAYNDILRINYEN